MKRLVFSHLLFLFFSTSFSQYAVNSYSYKQEPEINIAKDEEIMANISSQTKSIYLKPQERELLYWMNFSRKYPKRFYDEVVLSYLKTYPEMTQQKRYANTLKGDLYKASSLPFLIVNKKLIAMAREHAEDVKKNGVFILHSSGSGLDFKQRAKKYGMNAYLAENLSYGSSSVLMQLVLLYLDIGLPDLGHRKNLLNPLYTDIGLALITLNDKEIFFVQDFSSTL